MVLGTAAGRQDLQASRQQSQHTHGTCPLIKINLCLQHCIACPARFRRILALRFTGDALDAAQAEHDREGCDSPKAAAERTKRRSLKLERRLSELPCLERPINETAQQNIGTRSYLTQHAGTSPESTRRKRSSVFRMGGS